MLTTLTATLALLGAAPAALAGRQSFTGIHNDHIATHFPELVRTPSAPTLHRRDGGVTNLSDQKDASYLVNLTLNGAQFTVSIDTGSSDLWVASALDNATDTGKTGNVSYAVGSASGPIKSADLQFAGCTVKDQFFMAATDNESGSNFGIIGLGPNSGSVWFNEFGNSSKADTALTRIFNQTAGSQMYITSTLGRSADDPTQPFEGQLSIDEIIPGYEAVLQQPRLNLTFTDIAENQHWQTLLDADGFIVNGQQVPMPLTAVTRTKNPKQLTAVFDNGFTLPQLPKQMVDAIYANVSGATFVAKSNEWVVPCKSEINVSFKFAGVTYPVHPLDTVSKSLSAAPKLGCVGAFQAITFDSDGNLDMILGMGFLRNVYMLNSFGSLVDPKAGTPYVQLLSLNNDTTAMHNEFVKVRNANGAASRMGFAGTAAMAAAVVAGLMLW